MATSLHAPVQRGSGAGDAERFSLGPRTLLLILAFWTFFALLTAANRMVDPRTGTATLSLPSLALAFLESYLWALLTPPIFWLTSRFTLQRGRWVPRALLFVVVGVVAALFVDLVVELVRMHVFPPPRRRLNGGTSLFWAIARLRYLDDLMVYVAVLAAGFARDYFRRYEARQAEAVRLEAHAAQLQAQLAEARLSILRTQLHPHFLFNTLHAVSSLVERDPRGVRRMIARLSELLRYTLDGTTEQEIPLSAELELLGRYVEIMEIRFQGRLETSVRAPSDVQDALVPHLILQPLVENAMKHGVANSAAVGRIDVTAERVEEDLVLTVRDNGADGATPAATPAFGEEASPGVGLRNTRARLEQLYGAHQRFTLQPAPGGGMIAEIRLPYHRRADVRSAVPVHS
ncbi:MAG TPA: histidine kinase [Gemmatimonadaceae bacterium]|nr:histidine kinase [Gemmatimonadaceae bacterium]